MGAFPVGRYLGETPSYLKGEREGSWKMGHRSGEPRRESLGLPAVQLEVQRERDD